MPSVPRTTRTGVLAASAIFIVFFTSLLFWLGPESLLSLSHSLLEKVTPESRVDSPSIYLQAPEIGPISSNTLIDTAASITTYAANRVAPRITFIVIWSPRTQVELYLYNFFASVSANPSVELLLIKIDKYHLKNGECERELAAGLTGIREICMPLEEYYELHLEYLCSEWNCTPKQRKDVRDIMIKRFNEDTNDKYNSSYRPFRAQIFKKWIQQGSKLWGWCDLDVMLGNFDRTFPWELADKFDAFVAAWPSNEDRIHLFMPGHMMVFQNDPAVAREFFKLEQLSSVENYLNMPWITRGWSGPEEAQYSHLLFMEANITFVRFDGLVRSFHHLDTLDGVWGIENAYWISKELVPHNANSQGKELQADEAIVHPAGRNAINTFLRSYRGDHTLQAPIFSDDGEEAWVQMRDDDSITDNFFIWFDHKYAAMYYSPLRQKWQKANKPYKRYTMRRERGGPIIERFEPEAQIIIPPTLPEEGADYHPGNRPWVREGLYVHYQWEKVARWYGLPQEAIKPGDVLYIDTGHGAHIWDAQGRMYYERIVYVEKEL